jgi:hypothetical protein
MQQCPQQDDDESPGHATTHTQSVNATVPLRPRRWRVAAERDLQVPGEGPTDAA